MKKTAQQQIASGTVRVATLFALIVLTTMSAIAQPKHVMRVNAQALWAAPYNLNGEGQHIGIFEFGKYPSKNHAEFKTPTASINYIFPTELPFLFGSHATQVLGIVIARGAKAAARGFARKAVADMYATGADDYTIARYLQFAGTRNWKISNHSYGPIRGWFLKSSKWYWMGTAEGASADVEDSEDRIYGYYDTWARRLDSLLSKLPTQIPVFASGNQRGLGPDVEETHFTATTTKGFFNESNVPHPKNGANGYDVLLSHGTSKNAIVVGAINVDGNIWLNSSTGPTDDGRIKPDLVALGVDVTVASKSDNPSGYDTTLDGTSLAAPAVAGSLVLLRQYWTKFFAADSFTSDVARGLLIHTANDLGPKGPDYQYGWGSPDAKKAADYIKLNSENGGFTIRRRTLDQGKKYEFYIKAYANQYLKVTLAWIDPAGTPVPYVAGLPPLDSDTRMLVNDLDIRLYPMFNNVTGTEFAAGPYVLNRTKPSELADKGDNTLDNVEQVYFRSTNPYLPQQNFQHVYKVVISHKGTLQDPKQNFTVIVGGAVEHLLPPTGVEVSTGGTKEKEHSPLAAANSAFVAWNAAPGASKYDVQYRAVGSPTWTTVSNIGGTETLLSNLQPSTYQVRVRARNGNVVSNWTTVVQFFGGNPVAPKNTWVTNLTVTGAKVNWSTVSGVTQYNLKWARIAGDNTVLGSWHSLTVNGTSYSMSQLVPDGRYVAYVRSKYSNNLYSDWAPAASFYTLIDCNAYEASNTANDARTLRIGDYADGLLCKGDKEDWFKVYNPSGYKNLKVILYEHSQPYRVSVYRRSKSSGDLSLLPGSPPAGIGTKIFTLNNADFVNNDYYIQVWIADPNVNYSNSETYTLAAFTQAAPYAAAQMGGGESAKEASGMESKGTGLMLLYPNPAHRSTTVRFTASQTEAAARILVYDAAGREVYNVQHSTVWGTNETELPLRGLAPGVYFVVVETGEGRTVQRLSVVE